MSTIPNNADTPPTGWHVHVLPSGRDSTTSPASTWHLYRALYGQGYPWREATPPEIRAAEPLFNPRIS